MALSSEAPGAYFQPYLSKQRITFCSDLSNVRSLLCFAHETLRGDALLMGDRTYRAAYRALPAYLATVAIAVVCVGLLTSCSSSANHTAAATSGTNGAAAKPSATVSENLTPVPAPTPGGINSTVPSEPIAQIPTVGISASAKPNKDVVVKLVDIAAVNATATEPGEVSGPAAQITVRIKNSGAQPLNVDSADVELTDSAGNAGVPVTTSATDVFHGQIAAGAAATGVYVFRLPTNRRNPVVVRVTYTAGAPVAGFTGKIR
jgi:hypothetical protein